MNLVYPETVQIILEHPVISPSEWEKLKELELASRQQKRPNMTLVYPSLEYSLEKDNWLECTQPKLTVISSIYQPGKMFKTFLGNIEEQSIFHEVQVVLILVCPSDSEIKLAKRFDDSYPNVTVETVSERISIYSAWNRAIAYGNSSYITNMNVDDLRSPESLEVQLKYMLKHPWVDVGFQDFFFMLDHELDWESVRNIGAKTNLSSVTLTEMAWFGINPPHNAPIWKRELHKQFGFFSEDFLSAGDYEFWMRVFDQGAVFSKMHHSSVCYFLNPEGMSTSAASPSAQEEQILQEKFRKKIKFSSNVFTDLCLQPKYLARPWEGSESFTLDVLEKLKEVS